MAVCQGGANSSEDFLDGNFCIGRGQMRKSVS